MKVGIIGAGHAGVAAALVVAKTGCKVTLFSNENCSPYFRPRIPGIAFGQVTKEEALMHPYEWYAEQNIELKINEPVTEVTNDRLITVKDGSKYSFDKIIIATGAVPIIPPFAKKCNSDRVIPLWNIDQAETIKNKLGKIKKIIIIGGGVIGIETALRAVDAGLEVSIIELKERLMERVLSPKSSELLETLLKRKGIELLIGQAVEKVDDSKPKKVSITTDKTKKIKADLVILSIGNAFDLNFIKELNLQTDRAVIVDNLMHTSNINFFAAGDIAQIPEIINVCSALKATKQGKIAGNNSIHPDDHILDYVPEQISVQLKYNDFQLYAIGKTAGGNLTEEVLEEKPDEVYRALVKDGEKIVGIQMVGDLTDFKKYEKLLV